MSAKVDLSEPTMIGGLGFLVRGAHTSNASSITVVRLSIMLLYLSWDVYPTLHAREVVQVPPLPFQLSRRPLNPG